MNQYAQRIISTPGRQDGLAWQNPDGTWGGPVGQKIAQAIAEGYRDKYEPYHGYYYKVLKGKGPCLHKHIPEGLRPFLTESGAAYTNHCYVSHDCITSFPLCCAYRA